MLQVAACLEKKFDESTIVLVVTKLSEQGLGSGLLWEDPANAGNVQVEKCLQDCVKGGFLYQQSSQDITYRFVHDMIQGAAISLIQEDMLELVQFNVGKVLVDNLSME